MSCQSCSAETSRLRSDRAPQLPQNRLESATRAPQLAQGAARADPQFRHCRLSAGFEVPHFRQSMEATGNALDWCTKTYTATCRASKPDVRRSTVTRQRGPNTRKSCVKSEQRAILTEVQFIVGCKPLARFFRVLRGHHVKRLSKTSSRHTRCQRSIFEREHSH